jgi:apolipoprotein D and lipocalin family protein
MSKTKYLIAGLGLVGGGIAYYNARKQTRDLKTVDEVDLKRYAGKWYEIAKIPHYFEKGCACTTAEYSLHPEGYLEILNSCLQDGSEKTATGKAYPEEGSNNSKLNVQFYWPLQAKYWIMALDKDYQFALVGHPNRNYLWILSRYPEMDEDVYVDYLQIARQQGFDISRLELTEQYCQ